MEKIFNSYTIVNLRDIATKAGLKGHRRFVKKDLVEFMLKNKSKFSDLKPAVKKPRKNAAAPAKQPAKEPKKKKIIKPTAKPTEKPKTPPKARKEFGKGTSLEGGISRPKGRVEGEFSTRFRDKDFQIAVFGMTLKQFIKDSESNKKKYYDILLDRLKKPFNDLKPTKPKQYPVPKLLHIINKKIVHSWWFDEDEWEYEDLKKALKDKNTDNDTKEKIKDLLEEAKEERNDTIEANIQLKEYHMEDQKRAKNLYKPLFEKIAKEVIYDKTIKTMKGITDAMETAEKTLGERFRGTIRNNPAIEWDKQQYTTQKQTNFSDWTYYKTAMLLPSMITVGGEATEEWKTKKPINTPVQSTRQGYKGMAYVRRGGKKILIHFGKDEDTLLITEEP